MKKIILSGIVFLSVMNVNAQDDFFKIRFLSSTFTNALFENGIDWNKSIKSLAEPTKSDQWNLEVSENKYGTQEKVGAKFGEIVKKQLNPYQGDLITPMSELRSSPPLSKSNIQIYYQPINAENVEFNFRKLNGGEVRITVMANAKDITEANFPLSIAAEDLSGDEDHSYNKPGDKANQKPLFFEVKDVILLKSGATMESIKFKQTSGVKQAFYLVIIESFCQFGSEMKSDKCNEVVEVTTSYTGTNGAIIYPDFLGNWIGTKNAQAKMNQQGSMQNVGQVPVEISKTGAIACEVKVSDLNTILPNIQINNITFTGNMLTDENGVVKMKSSNPSINLEITEEGNTLHLTMLRTMPNGNIQKVFLTETK